MAAAPLKLLIDECLRNERLLSAIRRFNERHPALKLDVLVVGDPGAPALGADDAEVLEWSTANSRHVVTLDRATFISRYYEALKLGPAPALLAMKAGRSAAEMTAWLAMCCHALTDEESTSRVHFGPV